MSKVFSDAYSPDPPPPANAELVIKGGTGYAIWLEGDKEVYRKGTFDYPLPPLIESQYPDYSLYPQYTGYRQSLKKQTTYPAIARRLQRWTNNTMFYAANRDFMEYQKKAYKTVCEE